MICPYCNKEAIWTENKAIYGKNYGKSFMCYFCKPCNAYVGCHQNTRKPLGTMANAETREWRKKAHAVFDPMWKNYRGYKDKASKRARAYNFLRNRFGKEIHIGGSNIDTCKKIIEFVSNPSSVVE